MRGPSLKEMRQVGGEDARKVSRLAEPFAHKSPLQMVAFVHEKRAGRAYCCAVRDVKDLCSRCQRSVRMSASAK